MRGKPVRGAALSEHVSIKGTREGYRGNRGNGIGTSRIGNKDRGGHNNSFGFRATENSSVEETEPKTVASCGVHEGVAECGLKDGAIRLECGHELSIMTAECDNSRYYDRPDNMPVFDGYVENVRIKVLRYTGCSCVVVRRDLVSRDKLTGVSKMCVLLDGTVRRFPAARISVNFPYYLGECEALCAENPVYYLILGNIPKVRRPTDPDLSWGKERYSGSKELASVVQTRARKAKESKNTLLQVPHAIRGVDKCEVKQAQEMKV